GTTGQIAYYTASGTAIGGTNAVSVAAGGTGAQSANAALANLGLPIVSILNYGAVSGSDSTTAIQAAIDAVGNNSIVVIPAGTYTVSAKLTVQHANEVIRGMGGVLNCAMTSDYCLEIGGGGNYSYYGNKIENVILQPGAQSTK